MFYSLLLFLSVCCNPCKEEAISDETYQKDKKITIKVEEECTTEENKLTDGNDMTSTI